MTAELKAQRIELANEIVALQKGLSEGTLTDDQYARSETAIDELAVLEDKIEKSNKLTKAAAKVGEVQRELPLGTKSADVDKIEEAVMKTFKTGLILGTNHQEYAERLVELKNLNATVDAQGGYLTAPEKWVNELLKNVDDVVDIRRYSRVFRVTMNESLGVPSLDTDLDDAEWTTELSTGSLDTAMRIGKRELKANPFAKRIKLSKQLVRSSVIDVDQLIRDRIAYKIAVTEEKAFLTGDGAGKPLGLFVANDSGIPSSRDVSTPTGQTTSVDADSLINTMYSLKPQHLRNARWLIHRDWVKDIRKLKDGNGQYLWQPGLVAGQPDLILSKPFIQSEFAPNTKTAGQYIALIGDLNNYWIVDSLALTIQVVYELYTEANQIGYIIRKEVDGAPIWGEGFARLKTAAS